MRHEYKVRGHRWRVKSDERGRFDEIVVVIGRPGTPPMRLTKDGQTVRRKNHKPGNGLMLHAEMMNDRSMFVDVAGFCLWVCVDNKGIARITANEDRRKPAVYQDVDLRDPALDRKRSKEART
jgi:hypothetical protein